MPTHAHQSNKVPRRALPTRDTNLDKDVPKWMYWRQTPPPMPGWYWVWADGVWPQCVEYAYYHGAIRAVDRHDEISHPRAFWTMCAGPIPDPPTPKLTKKGRSRGQ